MEFLKLRKYLNNVFNHLLIFVSKCVFSELIQAGTCNFDHLWKILVTKDAENFIKIVHGSDISGISKLTPPPNCASFLKNSHLLNKYISCE